MKDIPDKFSGRKWQIVETYCGIVIRCRDLGFGWIFGWYKDHLGIFETFEDAYSAVESRYDDFIKLEEFKKKKKLFKNKVLWKK